MASLGDAVNTSQVLETEPWGFDAPQKFLNQSFCCLTELEPRQVLEACQRIETELGRVRTAPRFNEAGERIYESRVIDIDILAFERDNGGVWESVEVSEPDLVIPHPQLQSRDFARRLYVEVREAMAPKMSGRKKLTKNN